MSGAFGEGVVTVNPEKPGRGNVVVTEDGEMVVELLGMKRPFPALKALDMEEVIESVRDKLQ